MSKNKYALVTPKSEYGLAKQSFKEECDISEILKRAKNGQDIKSLINTRVARYGDFTNIPDYRQMLDTVSRAEGMFMELDAKVRERFKNDPAELIEFLQKEENREEAQKLGLLKAPETPAVPAAAAQAPSGAKAAPSGGGATQ